MKYVPRMKKHFWLFKTEPETYSIDDLRREKRAGWTGVRNYQARNFMRDSMRAGDLGLFYHSSCKPPGVAGVCRVVKTGVPDPTAGAESSVWIMVEVAFVEKFPRFIPLDKLRADPAFADMMVLKRGCRLSIQPVDRKHFERIVRLGHRPLTPASRALP